MLGIAYACSSRQLRLSRISESIAATLSIPMRLSGQKGSPMAHGKMRMWMSTSRRDWDVLVQVIAFQGVISDVPHLVHYDLVMHEHMLVR